METKSPERVSDKVLAEMREEAQEQLAEPNSDDVYFANYDWPARVNSRDLLKILDELEFLRKKHTCAH